MPDSGVSPLQAEKLVQGWLVQSTPCSSVEQNVASSLALPTDC